jgi:hypothetical protein
MTSPWQPRETPNHQGTAVTHGQRAQAAYRHRGLAGIPLGQTATPPERPKRRTQNYPLHCSVVAFDIIGFGLHRDDRVQLHIREGMYNVLREAFHQSDVAWHDCYRQDRGDGVLVVVPPTISTARLLEPMAALLSAGLRCYNEVSSEAAQIRLRMAVHSGSVLFDRQGVLGHSLTRLFYLLDAPAFKTELASTADEVGLVTSEYVYEDVIRHCSGPIDPAAYAPIEVLENGIPTRAWIHLPSTGGKPAVPHLSRMTTSSSPGNGVRNVSLAAQ